MDTRVCVVCGLAKERKCFSKKQWGQADPRNANGRCKSCVEDEANLEKRKGRSLKAWREGGDTKMLPPWWRWLKRGDQDSVVLNDDLKSSACVAISKNGEWLFFGQSGRKGYGEHHLQLYRMKDSSKPAHRYAMAQTFVRGVAIAPDDSFVLAALTGRDEFNDGRGWGGERSDSPAVGRVDLRWMARGEPGPPPGGEECSPEFFKDGRMKRLEGVAVAPAEGAGKELGTLGWGACVLQSNPPTRRCVWMCTETTSTGALCTHVGDGPTMPGKWYRDVSISPDGTFLLAAAYQEGSVDRIELPPGSRPPNVRGGTVTHSYPIGADTGAVCIAPCGTYALAIGRCDTDVAFQNGTTQSGGPSTRRPKWQNEKAFSVFLIDLKKNAVSQPWDAAEFGGARLVDIAISANGSVAVVSGSISSQIRGGLSPGIHVLCINLETLSKAEEQVKEAERIGYAIKQATADPSRATLAALKDVLDTAAMAAAKVGAGGGGESKGDDSGAALPSRSEIEAGRQVARSVELWLELSAEVRAAGTDRDAVLAAAMRIKRQRKEVVLDPSSSTFAPLLSGALRAMLDRAPSTVAALAAEAKTSGLQYALRWGECLQSVADVIAEDTRGGAAAAQGPAALAQAAAERASQLSRFAKPIEELFPALEQAQLGAFAGPIIAELTSEWHVSSLADLKKSLDEEDIGAAEMKDMTGAGDKREAKHQLKALQGAVDTLSKRQESWLSGGGGGGGGGGAGGAGGAALGGEGKEGVRDKTRLPYDSIEVHEELGKGAFGTVNHASLTQKTATGKITKITCAAKRVHGAAVLDPRKIREILAECHIMFDTDHPFICACYGHARAPQDLLMVMEFCDGGDLLGRARKAQARGEPMPRAEMLQLCLMAASAIKYIHGLGMIHRDIAARNFLVTKSPEGVVVCKMADFGMSRKMEDDKDYYALDTTAEKDAEGKVVSLEIPVAWSAPECFVKQLGKDGHKHYVVGPPNDVWAFNVTAFEATTGGLEPYTEAGTIQETDKASGKVVRDCLDSRSHISKFVRDGGRLVVPPTAPVSLQATMKHCWTTGTAAADRQTMPQVIEALRSDKLLKAREWGSKQWLAFVIEECGIALSDDQDQVDELVEYWDDDDMKDDDELFKASFADGQWFRDPIADLAKFKRELAGFRGLFAAADKGLLFV